MTFVGGQVARMLAKSRDELLDVGTAAADVSVLALAQPQKLCWYSRLNIGEGIAEQLAGILADEQTVVHLWCVRAFRPEWCLHAVSLDEFKDTSQKHALCFESCQAREG
jgi:hypothetical protein